MYACTVRVLCSARCRANYANYAPPPSGRRGRAWPPGAAAYVYYLHILRARVKFLVDIIARRIKKVRVEFRLSQVHFRVPVVPLFLHQNTIIYPGKCGPFGNFFFGGGGGGCVRTRRTPPPPLRTGLRLLLITVMAT